MGISTKGKMAEKLFMEFTGAVGVAHKKDGDAAIEGENIEIKLLDGKSTGTKTINQVRANKYIPLVVYHYPTTIWYVVPPHIIAIIASNKSRGQHGENPFDNCTINLDDITQYKVSNTDDLRQITLSAIEQSKKYSELPLLFQQQRNELMGLSNKHKSEITKLLPTLETK